MSLTDLHVERERRLACFGISRFADGFSKLVWAPEYFSFYAQGLCSVLKGINRLPQAGGELWTTD